MADANVKGAVMREVKSTSGDTSGSADEGGGLGTFLGRPRFFLVVDLAIEATGSWDKDGWSSERRWAETWSKAGSMGMGGGGIVRLSAKACFLDFLVCRAPFERLDEVAC